MACDALAIIYLFKTRQVMLLEHGGDAIWELTLIYIKLVCPKVTSQMFFWAASMPKNGYKFVKRGVKTSKKSPPAEGVGACGARQES